MLIGKLYYLVLLQLLLLFKSALKDG